MLNWTKASMFWGLFYTRGEIMRTEFLPLSPEAVDPVFSPPDETSTLM
jgi:hypothetical protein